MCNLSFIAPRMANADAPPRKSGLRTFVRASLAVVTIAGAAVSAAADQRHPYLLDYGDQVRARAVEWPGLDGVVIVGADGTLAVPLVGNIQARGKTVQEVADLIADRLREKTGIGERPSVSASITKYRPYYILGYVQTPGEYDYQPDLTVLKAISRAGGLFRQPLPLNERLSRDLIQARAELRAQGSQAMRHKLRLTRITAQLDDKDRFDPPAELSSLLDDVEGTEILTKERAILTANRALLRQKSETAQGLARLSQEEIRSLEAQVESSTKQITIVDADKARSAGLAERGLGTNARVMEIELNYTRLVESRQALQTLIVRARQDVYRAETNLEELKVAEQKRLQDERQDAAAKLREAELLQDKSRQLIIEAEVVGAGSLQRSVRQRNLYKTKIERDAGEEHAQIDAQDATYIEPGDVLVVEEIVPASTFEATLSNLLPSDRPAAPTVR